MDIFHKKKPNTDVLTEAERIAYEAARPRCPKCKSTDVVKVVDWRSGNKRIDVWRGQRLEHEFDYNSYRCKKCGCEF